MSDAERVAALEKALRSLIDAMLADTQMTELVLRRPRIDQAMQNAMALTF